MEEVFNVQDAHVKLIETLMNKLNTNGVLYFSNNFRNFKMDEKLQEKFKIKDITRSSIPIDFRDPKIHVCFEIRHKA
jgi:23S rRNA (cytosine1962-C5)-methyltransferase